jgi:formate hydrogenlyase subunit 3/multisubunit Na+/H+ antiporter MnhD subunit
LATLLFLLPLAAVVILNLPMHKALNKAAFWFGALLCLFQAGLTMLAPSDVWNSCPYYVARLVRFFPGVDNLTLVMLLSIAIVGFVSLLTARYSIRDPERLFNFSNLVILAIGGMNGVVLADDLFSLYVFLEVTAVASFILIAFQKDLRALEGAFKYIIVSIVATVLMLAAIALILLVAPGTSFEAIAAACKAQPHHPFMTLAIALFLSGLFIKVSWR